MNGHQHPNRLKYAIILALGFGVTHIAGAVGLGPIVGVNSHLGQPLSASIRVDNISREQAQSASITLASAEEYRSRGIQRLSSHDQLRFKLVPSGNGYRIQVTSSSGIREPFINFLLTINVGGQKITREYALFLNPDASGSGSAVTPEPQPIAAPPAQKPKEKPVASTLSIQPNTAPAGGFALGVEPDPRIAKANPSGGVVPANPNQEGWGGQTGAQPVPLNNQPQVPANNAGGSKYTVKSGDTLYRIALAAAPSGTDVNAMMRAIQRANPHAFGSSSPNSLKAGATLTIPGGTLVASADTSAAQAQPAQPRNNRRNNRRNAQPPAASPETPPAEVAATQTPPADNPVASTPENPQPPEMLPDNQTTGMPPGDEGTAPALTAEVGTPGTDGQMTDPAAPQGTDNLPADPQQAASPALDTSLTLEGMDGVANTLLTSGEAPAMENPPAEMAPVSPDVTASTPPATETVAETPPPVVAESTPPAQTPPAATQDSAASGLELPFGLQLWHLLLAGGLLLAGLLLALLMKARARRQRNREEFTDMSPADLDRMVAELESDSSLQHSLSGNLHNLDELSYEALTQEAEKQQSQPHQAPQEKKADLLKARMAELDALKELEEENDDFKQPPARKTEQAPAFDFDLHMESGNSASRNTESPAASTQKREAADKLFGDWDFNEQEPTVQTSAHESNVDDFFNVDERLEDVIKPEPAASTNRAAANSGVVQAAVMETEVSAEKVEAMEINLDLATSFIATGNAARARVWLEEVLLDGSPAQKALATQLLKKVDAAK